MKQLNIIKRFLSIKGNLFGDKKFYFALENWQFVQIIFFIKHHGYKVVHDWVSVIHCIPPSHRQCPFSIFQCPIFLPDTMEQTFYFSLTHSLSLSLPLLSLPLLSPLSSIFFFLDTMVYSTVKEVVPWKLFYLLSAHSVVQSDKF